MTNRWPGGYKAPFYTNYPVGFTNELEITAHAYTSLAATKPALTNLVYPAPSVKTYTNAVVVFDGGNLTASITNKLFVKTNNTVFLPSTNSAWAGKTAPFTLSLTPASGAVSGTFYHPVVKKPVTFKGAILQDLGVAYGYFQGYATNNAGTNESGAITILKNP
jgi:hypothetical protein